MQFFHKLKRQPIGGRLAVCYEALGLGEYGGRLIEFRELPLQAFLSCVETFVTARFTKYDTWVGSLGVRGRGDPLGEDEHPMMDRAHIKMSNR